MKSADNAARGTIGFFVPAVYQWKSSSTLYIAHYVNGNRNHVFTTEAMTEDWFNLKINQEETPDGFKYWITINGKGVYSIINTTPKTFENVQAEFGRIQDHKDYQIADGSYRNLQVTSEHLSSELSHDLSNDFF